MSVGEGLPGSIVVLVPRGNAARVREREDRVISANEKLLKQNVWFAWEKTTGNLFGDMENGK